jgi:hypothetical protein
MVHVYTEESEPKKVITRRRLSHADRIFLRRWILSCVAGLVVVFVVANRIIYTIWVEGRDPHVVYDNDNAVAPVLMFAFLIMLGVAPVVGLCQLYAIHGVRRILSPKRWALGVALGAAISTCLTVLTVLAANASVFAVAGCLFGPGALLVAVTFGPGLGPWLLVVRPRRKAVGETGSSWIDRSMFGWPVVILLSFLSGMLSPAVYKFPFNDLISTLCWGLGWALGALLYGIYTGLALVPLIGSTDSNDDDKVPPSLITATV